MRIALCVVLAFLAAIGGVFVGRALLPQGVAEGAALHDVLHHQLALDSGQELRIAALEERFAVRRRTLELELRAANARLELLAGTDPLTGLANRRTMIAMLEAARETALRSGGHYVVAMLDIDRFKRINDAHGHQVGDMVIEAVATRIAASVRAVDSVARYGGEEIAILFADISPEEALDTSERVRAAVAADPIVANGIAVRVTVSGGIAVATGDTSPAELLHRADLALYRAKRAGRDRVVLDDGAEVDASAAR